MLILYALPVSGYCAKVRAVLRLKQIAFEERPPHGGGYGSEAWRDYMPPGSIPAIEHEGFRLFDSEAIVEYLDELVAEPALLSSDLRSKSCQRALSQFHNGRLEPAVRALFPLVKLDGAERTEQQTATAASRFVEQLIMLQRLARFDPFVSGVEITFADCSCPVTIQMGLDILAWLGQQVDVPVPVSDYLVHCQAHPVLGDEMTNNRTAVTDWMDRFIP